MHSRCTMLHLKQSLFLLHLLFASLISLSQSRSLLIFQACLPSYIPLFLQSTSGFKNLTSLSFVNNRASPKAVVRVQTETQVAQAVKCAQRAKFGVCARSGGHSLAGKSLCNGILIDVRDLRQVRVLPGGIAEIGGGAIVGEVLWGLWNNGRRWFASGVCPGVGMGGYVFGGGHGPYEGTLGLACDSLKSVRIVDRFGNVLVASNKRYKNLFWGLCGAGGGQFGIVTSFKIKTASSKMYDRGAVFRFNWPHNTTGELLHKWMDYGEAGGRVWFRIIINLRKESGTTGYGACYDVGSAKECMQVLKKGGFFNTAGRVTNVIFKVKNALELHAFFGPEGGWARKRPKNLKRAMLEQRYSPGGANSFTYQSAFLNKDKSESRPSVEFWQKYADFCSNPGKSSISWIVCELNLFNNAIDKARNNGFAHRGADIIAHYIVAGGNKTDRIFMYKWMKGYLRGFTSGVYVNYPELELGESYAKLYWGWGLARLKKIKKMYDPQLFFLNPQPIPRG